MSDQPATGGRAPLPVEVTAGEEYWWCACGRSQSQPFCDGSHASTSFEPRQYIAPESKRVFFCTCKRTKTMPLCDGSHKELPASAT
jgi:CDGSH iron-sulfur domain-containing protein 3